MLFVQGEDFVELYAEYCMGYNICDVECKEAVHDVRSWAWPVNQTKHIDIAKELDEGTDFSNENK